MQHLRHALREAGVAAGQRLGVHRGKRAVPGGVPLERKAVERAALQHRGVACAGGEGRRVEREEGVLPARGAVQRTVERIDRRAEILSRRGDGLTAIRLAEQLEEQVDGVHQQLLLQRSGDAAAQGALLVARVVQLVGVDHAAVAVERAAEQIVRGDVIVVARLLHKGESRLADAVFIVAQKRLRDAEVGSRLALGDLFLLPQQGQGARKISVHARFSSSFLQIAITARRV